jgi:peptide/nickel transport system permease protein
VKAQIDLHNTKTKKRMPVFFRKIFKSPAGMVGLIIVLFVIIVAVFSPSLAPYDPYDINLHDRLQPPSFTSGDGTTPHYMGTDSLGRDLLSRVIYGSRISLILGITATILGTSLGVILGMLAAYYGGYTDTFISWISNVQLAFPFTLLAIFIIAIFGGGLYKLVIVLAFGSWVNTSRIMRGQVLATKAKDYIEAARAIGARPPRIMVRHILPNSIAPVIVMATFTVAAVILSEASLSFLGLGVDPKIPTWGSALGDGRNYLQDAWWIATLPGLAILLTVLGINLLGDWLRDYLDPRLGRN